MTPHRPIVLAVFGAVLVSSAAVAAVTLTYNTTSAADIALKAPPIQWLAGPDSSGNEFVSSWTLSANQTYFAITLKPVPEANVTWGNLTTLRNTDAVAYSAVTVSGTSVSSYSKIQAFRLEFYDYAAPTVVAGALDLTQASPSVTFSDMASGTSYFVKGYVKLATDTGSQDLPSSITISLAMTP